MTLVAKGSCGTCDVGLVYSWKGFNKRQRVEGVELCVSGAPRACCGDGTPL